MTPLRKEAFLYPLTQRLFAPGVRWLETRTERLALQRLQQALQKAVPGIHPGTVHLPGGQTVGVKSLQELGLSLPSPMKTAKAHRLARRLTFRGLQISVETDKGQKRHWYDPHEKKHGTTSMKHAYGYIRRTEGIDGDHVDVYVGPNEEAKNVYIVHQMKAPDFKKFDEDKCMLGFDTLEEAKEAYLAHYNKPGFLGSVTTMPFEEFKEKVMKTYDQPKKLAEVIALIKQGNLRAGMKLLRPSAGVTGQAVAQRAGLTAAEAAGPAAGRMHAMVPSMTARPSFNAADVMNRVRQQGGEQALRDLGAKVGQHTMIGRPAPTWGLKGPTPQGFQAPKPAPVPGTAAGVPQQQHAWQQQASRTSAGSPPANTTANRDVADVVSRGNRQMGQVLRDTSGNPGVPPALTKNDMGIR